MGSDGVASGVASMDPVGFGIVLLLLGLAAAGGLYGAFRFHGRARLIEDTPTSRICSAAQGYVEFEGRGELMQGAPIVAPLSGRPCTWYRFKVEEKRQTRDAKGNRHTQWHSIRNGSSDELFLLVDDTGRCVIDPEGAEVTPSARDVWYGRHPQPDMGPVPGGGGLFAGGRYRYTEERLAPGEPLFAIGLFKTVGGAGDAGSSSQELRATLAAWKKDPERMRRFDADGDGRIDPQEWEQARKAAHSEVAKARAERAATAGTNIMVRPADRRRPYLLSHLPQQNLVRRYRWFARGALVLLFLAGAGEAWLVSARFSS